MFKIKQLIETDLSLSDFFYQIIYFCKQKIGFDSFLNSSSAFILCYGNVGKHIWMANVTEMLF